MIHRKFYAHKPIHGKNKRCKGSMLNVHDSLIVTPFLLFPFRSKIARSLLKENLDSLLQCRRRRIALFSLLQKPLALIWVQYTITNYSKLWNTVIIPCCNFNIFKFTLFYSYYSLFNNGKHKQQCIHDIIFPWNETLYCSFISSFGINSLFS